MRKLVLICTVGCACALGTGSAAAAAGRDGGVSPASAPKAKVNIQQGNHFCGANLSELPVIGNVSFKRPKPAELKLKVALTHGTPETTYEVNVFGDECQPLGVAFQFTTNANGVGRAAGMILVPGEDTEFFADVDTEGPYGEDTADTPYVVLP